MSRKEVQLKFKVMTSCARDVGIKPGKKWSSSQRKKVDACVAKKVRSK
jgi:hypothetical protein